MSVRFFISATAAPPIVKVPLSGVYIPDNSLIMVDLPEPDSPKIKIFSFCLKLKFASIKIFSSVYPKVISFTSIL